MIRLAILAALLAATPALASDMPPWQPIPSRTPPREQPPIVLAQSDAPEAAWQPHRRDWDHDADDRAPTPAPEPASAALLLAGVVALLLVRRTA